MRVEVDTNLCQAYGNCMLAAPTVFELTERMPVVVVLHEHPDDSLRADVESAVLSCPVQALTVHDV